MGFPPKSEQISFWGDAFMWRSLSSKVRACSALTVKRFGGASLLAGVATSFLFWVNANSAAIEARANQSSLAYQTPQIFKIIEEVPISQEILTADVAVPDTPLDKVTGKLRRNDTLGDLLLRLGATNVELNKAIIAIKVAEPTFDEKRLKPGLIVSATFEERNGKRYMSSMSFEGTPKYKRLMANRKFNGDYVGAVLNANLFPIYQTYRGKIYSTLTESAEILGINQSRVSEFTDVFAFDLDFQRDLRKNDQFEFVFKVMVDENEQVLELGDLVFASFDGKKFSRSYYHHTPSDDKIPEYFDQNGESARTFLRKTPIDGARISSGFGFRKHPISGYTRKHKGVDFAAARGTEIYAAGDGIIERVSTTGSYGYYIKIDHANSYQTAYAHMSRFADGMKLGKSVRQDEVIGYVGTTGRSTGPHLHYEVIHKGEHVNAMTLNFPRNRKLEGKQLDEFMVTRSKIDAARGVFRNYASAPMTFALD